MLHSRSRFGLLKYRKERLSSYCGFDDVADRQCRARCCERHNKTRAHSLNAVLETVDFPSTFTGTSFYLTQESEQRRNHVSRLPLGTFTVPSHHNALILQANIISGFATGIA